MSPPDVPDAPDVLVGHGLDEMLADIMALANHLKSKNIEAYIEQKQRNGNFSSGHDAFHGTLMPRVGNWVLSLSASMLGGAYIRDLYNDTAKLGKFIECLLRNMSEGKAPEKAAAQAWVLLLLRLIELLDTFTGEAWDRQTWKLSLEQFQAVAPLYFPSAPPDSDSLTALAT